MNFENKDTDAVGFGILIMSVILFVSYFGAETPVIAQTAGASTAQPAPTSDFNAKGYEATPVPKIHHHHKNLMTPNTIAGEGAAPGKPIDGENPALTAVPAASPTQ
jgi:hypothetical protein